MVRTLAAGDRLETRIADARLRTLRWLDTMAAAGEPRGVMRFSAFHDPIRWPGVLLPGTYNGILCLALLDGTDRFGDKEHGHLVTWLEAHRRADGAFRVPGMTDADVFKKPDTVETWTYIDFHVTNYALGAIEMLEPGRAPVLDFMMPLTEPAPLEYWLGSRDWSEPWLEGNNLVNLASFLLLLQSATDMGSRQRADRAILQILDHLEASQNPDTGFWGEGQDANPTRLLHAMAGAMHIFHLWYAEERVLPHQAASIDYVLGLDPSENMGACLDVDCVDLLVNGAYLTGHRRADIEEWLRVKLGMLLDIQKPDGGFDDAETGTLRLDGWVRGYAEPQGTSNTFATWFRWIAIAMADSLLWPGRRTYNFRRMIGIGYLPNRQQD